MKKNKIKYLIECSGESFNITYKNKKNEIKQIQKVKILSFILFLYVANRLRHTVPSVGRLAGFPINSDLKGFSYRKSPKLNSNVMCK